MLRYLTIRKFAAESGYTEGAIRSKIRDGIWADGQVWVRAPDGRILIDVQGYEKWVESGPILKAHQRSKSKSPSPLGVPSPGKKGGRGLLPPLT
jgi:hypothetical protein